MGANLFDQIAFAKLEAFFPYRNLRVPVPPAPVVACKSGPAMAACPPPTKPKPAPKPVAKVTIRYIRGNECGYWFEAEIGTCNCQMHGYVSKREKAVAEARKFCKSVGHRCKIVK
jgi:hypothetical protein